MPVPIENNPNLGRDTHSMGIINTNRNNWSTAQSRKLAEVRKLTEFENLKEKVNAMDQKLCLILSKLEALPLGR